MARRSSPIRASKSARKASIASGSDRSMPAAQACAVSMQNPRRSRAMPRAAAASAMAARPATSVPSPKPLPAEFSRMIAGASSPPSTSASTRASPSARRCVPNSTPAPRCEPMWTLTYRAAKPGAVRRSEARTPTDRPNASSSGPARLTRYEAWTAIGRMSNSTSLARNASASAGGFARRRQAVGLSVKICSAVAPISLARSTARTIPLPSGRWAPRRRPSGSIRRWYDASARDQRRGRPVVDATVASYGAAPNGSACRAGVGASDDHEPTPAVEFECQERAEAAFVGGRRLGGGPLCSRRRWLVR